jgi:hypothetical protein
MARLNQAVFRKLMMIPQMIRAPYRLIGADQ